jgi:hypothetical protein
MSFAMNGNEAHPMMCPPARRERLDELRMRLETEMWKAMPLQPGWRLTDLKEMVTLKPEHAPPPRLQCHTIFRAAPLPKGAQLAPGGGILAAVTPTKPPPPPAAGSPPSIATQNSSMPLMAPTLPSDYSYAVRVPRRDRSARRLVAA